MKQKQVLRSPCPQNTSTCWQLNMKAINHSAEGHHACVLNNRTRQPHGKGVLKEKHKPHHSFNLSSLTPHNHGSAGPPKICTRIPQMFLSSLCCPISTHIYIFITSVTSESPLYRSSYDSCRSKHLNEAEGVKRNATNGFNKLLESTF